MRESRPYGFVRGALSNERPYRVSDDFRVWHFSDMPTGLLDVCLLGQSGHRSDVRQGPSSALYNCWPCEILQRGAYTKNP